MRYVTVVLPTATPVSAPVPVPIVAIDAEAVDQVPPAAALFSKIDDPIQTEEPPVIAGKEALTVTILKDEHPAEVLYVILLVPAEIPVIRPVVTFAEATVGVPLDQVPGAGLEVSDIV